MKLGWDEMGGAIGGEKKKEEKKGEKRSSKPKEFTWNK
jgi:hypothetical protein